MEWAIQMGTVTMPLIFCFAAAQFFRPGENPFNDHPAAGSNGANQLARPLP